MTGNKGRVVNFKNTIIIMTSNLGSNLIRDNFEQINENNRKEVIEQRKNEVFDLLKQTIRPEFLNRIDELIMFTPLNKEEIKQIIGLQIEGIQKMLANNGVHLELSEKALDFLSAEGYDPQFGARPVKRTIQRYLQNDLSKQIIAGTVSNDKTIEVDFNDSKLVFRNK